MSLNKYPVLKELHSNSFLVETGFNHTLVVLEDFKSVLNFFEDLEEDTNLLYLFKSEVKRSLFAVPLSCIILLSY